MEIKKVMHRVLEKFTRMLITDVIRPLAEDYIKKSPNKIDDILLPFLDELEKNLLEAADNIDGEDNV